MNTNTNLTQFARTEILEQIGWARLDKILRTFAEDLSANSIPIPDPESLNGNYFSAVSDLFASRTLPARLRDTLAAVETAAKNTAWLDDAIKRRIPCVGLNYHCPLDCALEIWFAAPDELAQFDPSCSASSSSSSSSSSSTASPTLDIRPETSDLSSDRSFKVRSSMFDVQCSLPRSISQFPTSSVVPLPQPVDGCLLLDSLAAGLRRHVVLPMWAAEALALWIVHTFAFQLRDVSAYIGVESPEKRCGKTTLLTLISQLVHRPVVASNISPPAFFRVIEELRPTLLIDEADTFLRGNDELRGILNAGNRRDTAFVVRVAPSGSSSRQRKSDDGGIQDSGLSISGPTLDVRPETLDSSLLSTINSPTLNSVPLPLTDSLTHSLITAHGPSSPDARPEGHRPSQLATFSSWCPKMIASIGHLPETLPDRRIMVRMQQIGRAHV